MPQRSTNETIIGHRYALCVGIGQYTQLHNRNLRYAVIDATTLAERLADPQRGNFAVTLLTEPAQTSKIALRRLLMSCSMRLIGKPKIWLCSTSLATGMSMLRIAPFACFLPMPQSKLMGRLNVPP